MSVDLSGLSPKELASLISQAPKRQTLIAKRTPVSKVRSRILKFAKSEGYSIEELFGPAVAAPSRGRAGRKTSPVAGRKLGKVPAKYRNPANSKETWSGRGKQPRWLAAYVAEGRKPEEFLIKQPKK